MLDTKKNKKLDFSGQDFHVGFDVHRKDWKVTIRMGHMELKTFAMNPDPSQLASYMRQHYPGGAYHSVYEAGYCGYWIHRRLKESGFENRIVNPGDVPTKQKEKTDKRDPIDSRKLSRELENGSLEGIYVPSEEAQSIRSFSRVRYQIVQRNIQIKNRIKSFLHFQGIELASDSELKHWSGRFLRWLNGLSFGQLADRQVMEMHLEELDYQRQRLKKILKEIRSFRKKYPVLQILGTVSGIGSVTAFCLFAELIDIHRFKNFDMLACYVGLIPSTRSTSDRELSNSLTPRHAKHLRSLLIEAAWRAVRLDPALTLCFRELCRKMDKQKAIIRVAKKLLSRVRYVWKNNKSYEVGVVE